MKNYKEPFDWGMFLALVFGIAGLFAFAPRVGHRPQDQKNAAATANQYQGVFIFSDATPLNPYTVIGTVKVAMAGSGQYEDVRDKLLKKCKKEHPTAQGLILNLKAGRVDQADAITFD